VRQRYN